MKPSELRYLALPCHSGVSELQMGYTQKQKPQHPDRFAFVSPDLKTCLNTESIQSTVKDSLSYCSTSVALNTLKVTNKQRALKAEKQQDIQCTNGYGNVSEQCRWFKYQLTSKISKMQEIILYGKHRKIPENYYKLKVVCVHFSKRRGALLNVRFHFLLCSRLKKMDRKVAPCNETN